MYSVPTTSTNPMSSGNHQMIYPSRTKRQMNKRRHHQLPRYGNFQGYYGYRPPEQDQRFQYLQPEWFHDKQVLDIGT
jgi:hypothetical protein